MTLHDAAALVAYLEQTSVVHVVRFAATGGIQLMNAAMSAHLGLAEAPIGGSLFDYLTAADAVVVRERLSGASTASNPVPLNFCDAAGEPFTLLCHLTVSPDGGLVIGEAVYADEQQLQRQLIELNEELAALARQRQRAVASEQRARHLAEADNRDKDEGLAVIGHELRQPLNTAMAALGVLKLNPAGAARALQSLDRQIGYMARLVEDLLRASQVMRGAVTLEPEPIDLAQLVRDAAEVVEPDIRERGQQLTIEVFGAPVRVRVDISRMRQVFVNLLGNATKYTPAAGSIAVSLARIGDAACQVRIRDTGEGIAADALERVFDLFARGRTGGNGLGIGLAVARRLVDLHGGGLSATSAGVGHGSIFTVTLPLVATTSIAHLTDCSPARETAPR